jgi:hypothetical protein
VWERAHLEAKDARPQLLALGVVHSLHDGVVPEVRHHALHLLRAHRPPDQQLPVFLDQKDGDEAQQRADRDGAHRIVKRVPRHVSREGAGACPHKRGPPLLLILLSFQKYANNTK